MLDLSRNINREPICGKLAEDLTACFQCINDYHEVAAVEVQERIAKVENYPKERICLVQSTDEALDRMIQTQPQYRYVVMLPTFDGFALRFKLLGFPITQHFCENRLHVSPADIAFLQKEDLLITASPNNPTGAVLNAETLAALEASGATAFIDETYVDYSESGTILHQLSERHFVFRSFSKSSGVAGLRLGVLFGPEEKIAKMRQLQWYCNMSTFSLRAIEHAYSCGCRNLHGEQVKEDRAKIEAWLLAQGASLLPSQGNFIAIEDADERLLRFFEGEKIHVKRTECFGLPGYLRISLGTREDNQQLMHSFGRFLKQAQQASKEVATAG
jgi:histidinol-phosphate aminotransferase